MSIDSLKNILKSFVEGDIIWIAHKDVFNNFFRQNRYFCIQSLCFINTIADRAINSRTFLNQCALVIKKRVEYTVDK